ncbi:rhomboid family intramembrane serine protease [bacterium]|nr:rhomboid family intramembrane serine protease [bacterium]
MLDAFGIRPRVVVSLVSIPVAPMLHAGFAHLIANTIPLFGLGWFVMLRRGRDLAEVTATSVLFSGLGIWLLGAPGTVHIGASGVVFGYLGFLVSRGFFERHILAALISIFVAVTYGGLIWGVLPGPAGVSWQGHLFGFLGGVRAASHVRR